MWNLIARSVTGLRHGSLVLMLPACSSVLADECRSLVNNFNTINSQYANTFNRQMKMQICSSEFFNAGEELQSYLQQKIQIRTQLQRCPGISGESLSQLRSSAVEIRRNLSELRQGCGNMASAKRNGTTAGKEGSAVCPANLSNCIEIKDRGRSIKQQVFELHQSCKGVRITFDYTTCGTKKCETISTALNASASDLVYGYSLPTLGNFSCVPSKG